MCASFLEEKKTFNDSNLSISVKKRFFAFHMDYKMVTGLFHTLLAS